MMKVHRIKLPDWNFLKSAKNPNKRTNYYHRDMVEPDNYK